MLKNCFGNHTLSRPNLSWWREDFRSGCNSIDYDQGNGRLFTSMKCSTKNVEHATAWHPHPAPPPIEISFFLIRLQHISLMLQFKFQNHRLVFVNIRLLDTLSETTWILLSKTLQKWSTMTSKMTGQKPMKTVWLVAEVSNLSLQNCFQKITILGKTAIRNCKKKHDFQGLSPS